MEQATRDIDVVFERFLQKVTDYKFSLNGFTPDEIDEELFGYYKSAVSEFVSCRKDLSTNYSDYQDVPSGEKMLITDEVDSLEIEILSKLMLANYLLPYVNSSDNLQQVLGDRDFNLTSQASHLSQVRTLQRQMQSDADKAMTKYSYRGVYTDE